MNAQALSLGPILAPVGRLLWSRRLALPALGITSIAAFLGWVGAMIRFSRVTSSPGDPMFEPLVAAGALVMLPAAVGLLAGDAIQQLVRRASLRLLPDLRTRLLRSVGIGVCACMPFALGASMFRGELTPFTALGPAAIGFALGALFPGRARSGLVWVSAFALPLLADPLCTLAARPLFAASMVAVAAVALFVRVTSLLRPAAELRPSVTWLAPLAPNRARKAELRAARRGRPEVTPPPRIADRRDWYAAHRFEHRSGIGSILLPAGTFLFVLTCFTVSMVTPLLDGLSAGGASVQSLLESLVEAYVGPFDPLERLSGSASGTVVMVLWACSAVVAAVAGAPLLGDLLYPLSRRERADLSATITRRASLRVFASFLSVGAAFGMLALEFVGAPWPRALPTFAWAALVGLASAPWIQVLWLALAKRLRKSGGGMEWGVFFVGLGLPVVALLVLWDAWDDHGRSLTPPWILGWAAVLVIGWTAHRPLLRRHFSRCDLAG